MFAMAATGVKRNHGLRQQSSNAHALGVCSGSRARQPDVTLLSQSLPPLPTPCHSLPSHRVCLHAARQGHGAQDCRGLEGAARHGQPSGGHRGEGVTAQLPACPICCKARSYAHNTWQARTCKRRGLQVSCLTCPNPTYSPPPQFHDPAGPASLPACCRCTPARSIPHTFLTASALRSRQVG